MTFGMPYTQIQSFLLDSGHIYSVPVTNNGKHNTNIKSRENDAIIVNSKKRKDSVFVD